MCVLCVGFNALVRFRLCSRSAATDAPTILPDLGPTVYAWAAVAFRAMRLHVDPAPVQLSVEPETLLRIELECPGPHAPHGEFLTDPPTISALIRTPITEPSELPACPGCGTTVKVWTTEADEDPALFTAPPV